MWMLHTPQGGCDQNIIQGKETVFSACSSLLLLLLLLSSVTMNSCTSTTLHTAWDPADHRLKPPKIVSQINLSFFNCQVSGLSNEKSDQDRILYQKIEVIAITVLDCVVPKPLGTAWVQILERFCESPEKVELEILRLFCLVNYSHSSEEQKADRNPSSKSKAWEVSAGKKDSIGCWNLSDVLCLKKKFVYILLMSRIFFWE